VVVVQRYLNTINVKNKIVVAIDKGPLFRGGRYIVIMKVLYGLVLSLLLSVILSLSKVKRCQKANG
jgi:hypothetical protein